MSEIKRRGFWIINTSSIRKSVVINCVICPKLGVKTGVQIMADLPKNRFDEAAHFTYCTFDKFGTFKVKVKRSEVKLYAYLSCKEGSTHRRFMQYDH